MANTIRVELDDAGIRALLSSDETAAVLKSAGERIAQAANARAGLSGGYAVKPGRPGRTRTRAFVATDSVEAMRAEATGGNLLPSLDAAR